MNRTFFKLILGSFLNWWGGWVTTDLPLGPSVIWRVEVQPPSVHVLGVKVHVLQHGQEFRLLGLHAERETFGGWSGGTWKRVEVSVCLSSHRVVFVSRNELTGSGSKRGERGQWKNWSIPPYKYTNIKDMNIRLWCTLNNSNLKENQK